MEQLVFDTSAVLNCGKRCQLDFLLERLAGRYLLLTTPEVERELWCPGDRNFYKGLLKKWFTIRPTKTSTIHLSEIRRLAATLCIGELSTILLASELRAIAIVDEPVARNEAVKLRIKVNETLGMLVEGRNSQWYTDEQCLDIIRRLRGGGLGIRQQRKDEAIADYITELGNSTLAHAPMTLR